MLCLVGLVNIWFYWEGFFLIICYLLRSYWSLILMMMILSRCSVLPGSALSDPLSSAWSMVRCPAFGSPSTFGWSIGASLSGLSWPMMMVSGRHVWAADLVMMVSERHVWAADLVMGCGVPEAWWGWLWWCGVRAGKTPSLTLPVFRVASWDVCWWIGGCGRSLLIPLVVP